MGRNAQGLPGWWVVAPPCRGFTLIGWLVVGAAQTEDRRVEDLQTVLMKLPKVNLLVLDAVIKHLKE